MEIFAEIRLIQRKNCYFNLAALVWWPHFKSATVLDVLSLGQQGPEFNGYLVGRGNARDIDLNRNFPDLNALMYYYEKNKGRNHHLPLPDNWEQQVSGAG